MEAMAGILMVLGGIIALFGSVWMLIEQFKTGILWGLACLFIPLVSFVWLIKYWEEGKRPFGIAILGCAIYIGGMMLQ